MRNSVALLALFAWIAGHSLMAIAIEPTEPVNPFTQPASSGRGVSTNISDDSEAEEKSGFSLPKLSMPKLPKPSMPKLSMPSMPKISLPKVSMPQWTKKEPSRNSGPTTWEKLNSGTKSAFTKTRDTLMPWAVKDEKPPSRSVTGSSRSTGISRSRVASNRSIREEPVEKRSWLSSLLPSSQPDEKPIETTNDWLSQKRPLFDE